MRRYLGASWVDPETIRLHWDTSPAACLSARSGRVSPIYPLRDSGYPVAGPSDGSIVFVFPRSARQLLADIRNDFPLEFVDATFMSHGLAACVLILPTTVEEKEIHSRLNRPDIVAYEIWPVRSGMVQHRETTIRHRAEPFENALDVTPIDEGGIPEPIAQELRQFNANLTLLSSVTRDFVPEYRDLVEWLHDSVSRRIDSIREQVASAGANNALTSKLHHDVGILVDVNSCLTMVISQSAGVLPPIFNSNYPVGEFSLLGIGSATKAVWMLYQSVANVFARADHVTRLRNSFESGPFDPGFVPSKTDYESWRIAGQSSVSNRIVDDARPGRKHLVYFSSRWGFHETLNSISLSWQSITSCATRHWNLLTLSHEFLHSHFRELVRTNVLDVQDPARLTQICDTYNAMWGSGWGGPHPGTSTRFSYVDSFRAFLLNQLAWCHQAAIHRSGSGSTGDAEWKVDQLTPETASDLINSYLAEYVEEYVVHIMDFHYFFDGDDRAYLSSLWHSWALVPFVHKKLNHYLLRSLLALASTNTSTDAHTSFDSAYRRLVNHFREMHASTGAPIANGALTILTNQASAQSLWFDFKYSFQLVPFTRHFLIDPELSEKLSFDPLTSEAQRFSFREGEFSSVGLSSPTAFLLDRYEHAQSESDPADLASLWQLLMLA